MDTFGCPASLRYCGGFLTAMAQPKCDFSKRILELEGGRCQDPAWPLCPPVLTHVGPCQEQEWGCFSLLPLSLQSLWCPRPERQQRMMKLPWGGGSAVPASPQKFSSGYCHQPDVGCHILTLLDPFSRTLAAPTGPSPYSHALSNNGINCTTLWAFSLLAFIPCRAAGNKPRV